MEYEPSNHHRRSIRLKGYDYTRAGGYFVTLVTHARECLFGEIGVDGVMTLNAVGEIVREEWEKNGGHTARNRIGRIRHHAESCARHRGDVGC
jgi:hypothetical protein